MLASASPPSQTHGQGRLGYLQIPGMMAAGWALLHRDLEFPGCALIVAGGRA